MSTHELTRRRSSILSADVQGFSRLMSRNDVEAVRTINRHRRLMARQVEQHQGRVVDMAGDSLLAVFNSAPEAVHCALAIQERLRVGNRRLPQEDRMCFRLGIELGDVLHQGEQVYGDAVNIAARLQALAPPGGVFISGAVYRQVRGRLSQEVAYQGKKELKNIPQRVKVYGLAPQGGVCTHECDGNSGDATARKLVEKSAGAAMRLQEAFFRGVSALGQKARLYLHAYTGKRSEEDSRPRQRPFDFAR